ncbi:hypothetical protein ACPXCP_20270 [Streptomyces sp. DT20]|uniref:hypothetical protein n=1 Tax=Streptomyces sp. DT20 TaxID=3416519 RepID=UPI003CE82321
MIPDAVAAVLAATIRDHPGSTPEAVARAAVAALDREGWHIAAPDTIAAALRAA